MTDSGDVSSIKDVDMLELLRVGSSCQSQLVFSRTILMQSKDNASAVQFKGTVHDF